MLIYLVWASMIISLSCSFTFIREFKLKISDNNRSNNLRRKEISSRQHLSSTISFKNDNPDTRLLDLCS